MAASERQIELINRKLEDLQQDSQALHDALSSYVDHVTSMGRLWVESKGLSSSSYRDISNMLHNSVDFIMDTVENLKGMDKTEHSQMTGPALSQDMPTSSSSLSSPSSSSNLTQPMSPLADHFLLKLQSRLEIVEKEMTHVVEMKEQMDGLKEGMDKVKKEMGDFRDEISGLNADMKKVKKTKGKIENIQKRVEGYEESRTEMEETISEIRTDHDELSGQVRQLSDNYEETRVKNHGWHRKFEDKLYKHEQSSLSVTSDLETKIDGLNQRVITAETRMGQMEREKEGESAKVKLLDEKVKELEKDHDKQELIVERVEELESDMRDVQTIKLEEIEERISRLEEEKADREKQLMLEDRLAEIEEERRKEAKSAGDLNTELTRCVARVDEIDKRRQLQIAVHARLPRNTSHILKSDTVLTCFTELITNNGGHYDPSSGVFTAPVDGVYMTSLVHTLIDKNCVWLKLFHSVANPGPGGVKEKTVCETWTDVKYTSCTDVCIVWMSAGDKLYVKVHSKESSGNVMMIGYPSSFSCILIQ